MSLVALRENIAWHAERPGRDVDGAPAGGTLTVRLDGIEYEIDLSVAELRRLRAELRPWIACARLVGAPAAVTAIGERARRPAPTQVDRIQLDKMRQWARQNGHQISPRGRVPAAVQQAFHDAHA